MKITIDKVMACEPCSDYPRKRVRELFGNRKSVTPREVAESDLPIKDRIWLLCKLAPNQRKLARRFALDVVHLWNAPPVVIEYLHTGDESLRAKACKATNASEAKTLWMAPERRAAYWATCQSVSASITTWAAMLALSEINTLDKYLAWALEACEEEDI